MYNKTKNYQNYPGHGGGLIDLHDILCGTNDSTPNCLEQFIDGIQKIVTTEIGLPLSSKAPNESVNNYTKSFTHIVSLESPYVPPIGALLAKNLKLPYAKIKNEQVPGPSYIQEYGIGLKKKRVVVEKSAIKPKPDARVLLIHYLMATGDNLVACQHLLN